EHKELAPHADLRQELLKRRIQAAADDPRPGISMEEMKALMREKRKAQNRLDGKSGPGADAPGLLSCGPPVTSALYGSAFPPGRGRLLAGFAQPRHTRGGLQANNLPNCLPTCQQSGNCLKAPFLNNGQ